MNEELKLADLYLRVARGEKLTAEELRLIKEDQSEATTADQRKEKKQESKREPRNGPYKRAWAVFWGVDLRSVQRWHKKRVPYDEIDPFIKWTLTQKQLPPGVEKRIAEIRLNRQQGQFPGYTHPTDPEFNNIPSSSAPSDTDLSLDPEFSAMIAERSKSNSDGKPTPEDFEEFYNYKLRQALERGRLPDVKFWGERYERQSAGIRANKLAAQKLGIETGDLYSRPAIEKILKAVAFRLNAGLQSFIHESANRYVGLASVIEVIAVHEDELLRRCMQAPFHDAKMQLSGVGLPEWVAHLIDDTLDDFIEIQPKVTHTAK